MGINNYYQWEYIGKHIHFDLLLVESEIVLCENKKSQKIEGRFRKRWGENSFLGYVTLIIHTK